MIRSHARALAIKSNGIPTSGSAFLLNLERVNHIDFSISSQRPFHHVFKPCFGQFPALPLRIPVWLVPVSFLQPVAIALVEWKPQQNGFASRLPEGNGNQFLIPDSFESGVLVGVLRHRNDTSSFLNSLQSKLAKRVMEGRKASIQQLRNLRKIGRASGPSGWCGRANPKSIPQSEQASGASACVENCPLTEY